MQVKLQSRRVVALINLRIHHQETTMHSQEGTPEAIYTLEDCERCTGTRDGLQQF